MRDAGAEGAAQDANNFQIPITKSQTETVQREKRSLTCPDKTWPWLVDS